MTIKTKTLAAFLLVLVLTIGVFAGSLLNGQEKALATTDDSKNTVSVQGEGIIRVTPDVAYVTMGVETSNKEMAKAQNENKEKMSAIVAELKRLGVNEKDIQTQNYNVYPDYQWQDNKSILVGYRVSNQVRVKVVKLDDTGKILDAVAGKGANVVNGIQFTVSDSNKAYQQALELALKNAEEKAKVMVGYFGVKNIKPITIVEGAQYSAPIYWSGNKGIAEAADSATPISAGEMDIRAQVSVTFEY